MSLQVDFSKKKNASLFFIKSILQSRVAVWRTSVNLAPSFISVCWFDEKEEDSTEWQSKDCCGDRGTGPEKEWGSDKSLGTSKQGRYAVQSSTLQDLCKANTILLKTPDTCYFMYITYSCMCIFLLYLRTSVPSSQLCCLERGPSCLLLRVSQHWMV